MKIPHIFGLFHLGLRLKAYKKQHMPERCCDARRFYLLKK
jgi:hypothetical protein